MDFVFLCGLAGLAGFVDAIGGGGGLIQLPALFLFLPPGLAASIPDVFGTNKLSSICGTGTAVVQYGRRVRLPWRSVGWAVAAAFVFALLGARVVTLVRPSLLRPTVLILLIVVAVYTFWRKDFGRLHAPALGPSRERLVALLVGMVIGFYDGFFGPGTGSFLIFLFIGVFRFDFLAASASAKVVNFATNLAAVGYFAWTGHVLWAYAVPMAVCNVLGSLVGARLAILKGNAFVRGVFLLVVTAMILRFGWEVLRG